MVGMVTAIRRVLAYVMQESKIFCMDLQVGASRAFSARYVRTIFKWYCMDLRSWVATAMNGFLYTFLDMYL